MTEFSFFVWTVSLSCSGPAEFSLNLCLRNVFRKFWLKRLKWNSPGSGIRNFFGKESNFVLILCIDNMWDVRCEGFMADQMFELVLFYPPLSCFYKHLHMFSCEGCILKCIITSMMNESKCPCGAHRLIPADACRQWAALSLCYVWSESIFCLSSLWR